MCGLFLVSALPSAYMPVSEPASFSVSVRVAPCCGPQGTVLSVHDCFSLWRSFYFSLPH